MEFIKQFYKKHNLRPFQFTWLLYVHLVAILGIGVIIYHHQNLLNILLIMAILHFFSGLGITGGVHRLWAHKSYSATLPMRIFLMLCNSMSNQGSIFHWSRDHRLHHKFSDTDLDPHNINNSFFFSHVGWLLTKKSRQLVQQGKNINMQDLLQDKVVMFQKKYYPILSLTFCFGLPSNLTQPALLCIFFLQMNFLQGYFISTLSYVLVLNVTWCVNSVCHRFGTRTWNKQILPCDNYLVSLVTLGEGYHNFHHEYPSDWRASYDSWYMYNPTARFIEFCKMVGLAK